MLDFLGKLLENTDDKWHPTDHKVRRITRRLFFGRHPKNHDILAQRVTRKVFGEVWGNWGKNFRRPKNLPAPTFMYQQT